MLTTEQIKAVQNIDNMINLIKGLKDRYRIYIISDPRSYLVTISIASEKDNHLIGNRLIHTDQNTYIDVINALRNKFILYGALVSKLTRYPSKAQTTYCHQSIYLDNLEMNIQINNKEEELEAVKAHAKIMIPDIPLEYDIDSTRTIYNTKASKTKTIQFK